MTALIIVLLCLTLGCVGVCAYLKHTRKITAKSAWLFSSVTAGVAVAIAVISAIYSYNIPQIRLNGEKQITVSVFEEYTDAGAAAFKGGKDISADISVNGSVDTSKLGEYVIEYSVTSGKRQAKIKRTVKVVDTTAPNITLNGEAGITVSSINSFNDAGATATDNYDGDLTAQITVVSAKRSEELYEYIYSVTDSSGNKAEIIRTVNIKDIVAPIITVNGRTGDTIPMGSAYSDLGATATDDTDGALAVSVSGSVNTAAVGKYVLTYSATDKAGNTGTATRTVWVYSPDDPSVAKICLTFDDGPSSNVTPRILDILKANDVKATFFIIDYSADKLPILRRMIDEGHTIGIHGYSHEYSKIYASDEAFIQNIKILRDKLYNDTGYDAKFIRFPGGSSNTKSASYNKGIMTRLSTTMLNLGYQYFDWNVGSSDASGNKMPVSTIYNSVISGLRKGRTNVVLMHDTNAKTTTADALQSIINYGKSNGYVFAAIDDTTPVVHHGINN